MRARAAGCLVRARPVVAGIPRPQQPSESSVFRDGRRPSPHPGTHRLVASAFTRCGFPTLIRIWVERSESFFENHMFELFKTNTLEGRRDKLLQRVSAAGCNQIISGTSWDWTSSAQSVGGVAPSLSPLCQLNSEMRQVAHREPPPHRPPRRGSSKKENGF